MGLVVSVCGLGGGYCLGMDLYVIFIGIVIVVVDELVDVIKCNGKGDC